MIQIITDPEKIDRKAWSDFVFNHPQGNIFQSPEMYDVYKNTKNYSPVLLAAFENHKMTACLLAVIQKEYPGLFGKFTARAIIFGGPIVMENDFASCDKILFEYNNLIEGKAIYTQIRNFHVQDEVLVRKFKTNGFVFENHLNILVDLSVGVENLWKGIKRNRKDGINKAIKQNFEFTVSPKLDDVSAFYQLLKDLYATIKLPYPDISFFYHLNNELSEGIRWFTLELNGKPMIILCALISKRMLHAFTIGISQDKDFHIIRPVDLFYWEVLKWASENGLKLFDWMGAGKPDEDYGVRKFKLQYGGKVSDFGRYIQVHNRVLFSLGKWGLQMKKMTGK